MMRKALIVFVSIIGVCTSAFAAEGAGLQKITDHVYAYAGATGASAETGFGANAGVVVGSNAALVVDTLLSPKMAEKFMADIRKVTDKPIKYVANTHYHLDHAWGNQVFAGAGAVIIGQENSSKDMTMAAESLKHPEMFGLTTKDVEGIKLTPATILFPDRLTVDLGDVTVELNYPGPTHTNDSITVAVPQDKVMFTGDILFSHYNPYLAEGDIANWTKVLGELQKSEMARFIPGHGPVSSKTDLADMKKYLEVFDKEAKVLCAGKTAADAPAIAAELAKMLPQPARPELPGMVEMNLRAKYLPQPAAKPEAK
jgi:cyclase